MTVHFVRIKITSNGRPYHTEPGGLKSTDSGKNYLTVGDSGGSKSTGIADMVLQFAKYAKSELARAKLHRHHFVTGIFGSLAQYAQGADSILKYSQPRFRPTLATL